jgi:hypothetical protein
MYHQQMTSKGYNGWYLIDTKFNVTELTGESTAYFRRKAVNKGYCQLNHQWDGMVVG